MLGFQYMVAKSRELTAKLDRELTAAAAASAGGGVSSSSGARQPQQAFSAASAPSSAASSSAGSQAPATAAPLSPRNEGRAFLRAQHQQYDKVLTSHRELVHSGDELATALTSARSVLQAQAASEQFLAQNFHLVARVRQQLAGIRGLVLKLADDAEDVEQLLAQRCEEAAARQNAAFAARQQEELERFEEQIAQESEGRKREILEARRLKLARAFQEDLKTYQTLVAYHGDSTATAAVSTIAEPTTGAASAGEQELAVAATGTGAGGMETLDSIDLVVTADADQLEAFYDSGSDEEEKLESPKFGVPPVPAELEEEEEEKSEEKEVDEAQTEGAQDEEERAEEEETNPTPEGESEEQALEREKTKGEDGDSPAEELPAAAEATDETGDTVEEKEDRPVEADQEAVQELAQEAGSEVEVSDAKEGEQKP